MFQRFSYLVLAMTLALSVDGCRSARVTDVPPTVTPPHGEVAAYKVQINVRDGKCIFNYDGPHQGQRETELLAPCEFVRDRAGAIRYLADETKGVGKYSVILVIGGPPAPGGHPDQYMKTCASELRAISLSPRGVALGTVGSVFALCPTYDVDNKMFLADASPV
jgi:hypothetical protein